MRTSISASRLLASRRPLAGILALLGAVGFAGCKPDLGAVPFNCNRGIPECPDGYRCVREGLPEGHSGMCVKEGQTLPPVGDSGPEPDSALPDGFVGDMPLDPDGPPPLPDKGPTPDQTPVPSGVIVISEFMADPNAVNDGTGEYVELYNPGKASVNIHGWKLRDDGSDSHVIAAPNAQLIIPPKTFVVLGRSDDKSQNGGITVAYVYTNFFLSNSAGGDEIILEDPSGKIIDGFGYSQAKGFTITPGAALSVKDPLGDKNNSAIWCTETTTWTGSAGDKGTPGANPGC